MSNKKKLEEQTISIFVVIVGYFLGDNIQILKWCIKKDKLNIER